MLVEYKYTYLFAVLISLIPWIILFLHRRDLLIDAFFTWACMVVRIFPFYLILSFISPGYIENIWATVNLSGIRFFGDPIEDIIFYFFFGFFVGPFYLYWKGERLRKK